MTKRPPLAAACTVLLPCLSAAAQILSPEPAVPDWVGHLLLGNTAIAGDPSSTQEELPGLGHKFELLYSMVDAQDPLNAANDVISVDTTGGAIGVAHRDLTPGVRITALTDRINLKYYFPARTCAGGSPRIDLAIDCDGDGSFDANAFGYVGHAPFGAGCVTGSWDILDMTDSIPRWDLTQLPGGTGAMTWQQVVAFVNTACPNHKILYGQLTDDSAGFAPGAAGLAYYDLVTIENRTLENDQDTVKAGH